MKKTLYPLVWLCLLLAIPQEAFTQQWFSDAPLKNAQRTGGPRQIQPEEARIISVDMDALISVLAQAPLWHTPEAIGGAVNLQLPMPNGHDRTFKIVEAPVMEEGLSGRYPGMRSFAGYSMEDGTAYARFGFTHKGFHAMILSGLHSTVYIDVFSEGQTRYHQVYYKSDYTGVPGNLFSCRVDTHPPDLTGNEESPPAALLGDCTLRNYRLAIACTGEYAQFHGGTVADVLAAYNVAMTRVNGVYERDFTVHMELVDETDQAIFLNAATDPFTNNSAGALISENQGVLDNIIGFGNYDVGHVFSTGGGGLASLSSVCTDRKARGVTGLSSPVNDPFYIDYVAHEFGHQFGANHTQNNSCNRVGATAMEPGSASTIMGYAGICSPNVQNNSDDYFHAISIQEATNNIEFGAGSTCPEMIDIDNTGPVITPVPDPVILPVSTPFFLTAEATDPEGDALTYCWEQMDNEIATMPPVSASTGGPSFRSLLPTPSPTRYFPNLDAVVSNAPDAWEVLPSVSRTMSFRCSVRDNFPGGGCVKSTDVAIVFSDDAGPFVVQQPNTSGVWEVGTTEEVVWDVAGTDSAPVNYSLVDIYLSTDGGFTYPVLLAQGVPNDGAQEVVVPLELTSTARVQVVGSGTVFYDISDEDFEIQLPPSPTVLLAAAPVAQSICSDTSAVFELGFTAIAGFDEDLQLSVSGLPGGALATFADNPVAPTGTTTLMVSNLGAAQSGAYELQIEAIGATLSKVVTVELDVAAEVPAAPTLALPSAGAQVVPQTTTLSWEAADFADFYEVEVATSPAFGAATILTQTVNETAYELSGLEELTVYYWRVVPYNECGVGASASWQSFQTLGNRCEQFSDTNPDLVIPEDGTGSYSTTLTTAGDFDIADLNVSLAIDHTWLGDLSATLSAEDGTTVVLFDQLGVPGSEFGCSEDNLRVDFDDDAALSAADLENSCSSEGLHAISGSFQPLEMLSVFEGLSATGTWTLTISDAFNQDGGNLVSWSIEACPVAEAPSPADTLANLALEVPYAQSEVITAAFLAYGRPGLSPDSVVYRITGLPQHGTLQVDLDTALALGATFTQADINAGILRYQHDGSFVNTDQFAFDLTDSQGGWRPGEVFRLSIADPVVLSAAGTISNAISCGGEADGAIEVAASGGLPPYTYALNGGDPQESPVFSGLSAGAYTITVFDVDGEEIILPAITLSEPDILMAEGGTVGNDLVVMGFGGTPPYLYSVNGGMDSQNSAAFSGLPNGDYTIAVTDENGCLASSGFTLNLVQNAEVTTTGNDCADGADGRISVSEIEGGFAPYQFSLNGGAAQTDPEFTGLESGDYTLVITDANGSTLTIQTVTVGAPAPLQLGTSLEGNNLTLEGSGGTPPYQYSIDGGVVFTESAFFEGLPNGTYNLQIVDDNGCSAATTITVNQILSATVIAMDATCAGLSDGSLLISDIEGGEAPYTYQLGEGVAQDSSLFEGLPAGTYVVSIVDVNGNVLELTDLAIEEPTPLELTAIVEQATLTLSATGGTPPYQYSIDGGANFEPSGVFTELDNGAYTVLLVDMNGCATSVDATVNIIVDATIYVQDISCAGDVNGSILVQDITGGVAPYTYQLNEGGFESNDLFLNLDFGIYNLEIQDSEGFIYSATVEIISPEPLEAAVEVVEDDIIITASGGTPPYLYSIDGGESFDILPSITGLPNGEYEIMVMDINGCQTELQNITIMVSGTGSFPADWAVRVSPNPTAGPLMMEGSGFEVPELQWSLINSLGQVLQSGALMVTHQQWQLPLSLEYLPSGMYWVELRTPAARGAWPVVRQ